MKDLLWGDLGRLWVVDLNRNDKWFQHLDWLTQFEVSRHLSQNLTEGFVLFSSPRHLPCELILFINLEDVRVAIPLLYQKWVGLGRPSLQIFLNQEISKESFQKEWMQQEPHILEAHFVEGLRV